MDLSAVTLPTILTVLSSLAFFVLERVRPGRDLPHVQGWYSRAISINLVQLAITVGLARLRREIYGTQSVLGLSFMSRAAYNFLETPPLAALVGRRD